MSDLDQIDHAVEVLGTTDLVLLHTTSTYPTALEELNLRVMAVLETGTSCPSDTPGTR